MAIDIDISHYNTGTATVAANGTAVTGQGTVWAGAVRAGDLFGTHKGDGTRILSVNSNTSLTLAYPWTGGAQTAAPYEIQRTPYDLGYQRAVEELIAGISDGNLPMFAALSAAANQLPYFDTAGSMALAPLTAFARTLLDDTDAATARTTLELLGWGDGTIPVNVSDPNTVNRNGFFQIPSLGSTNTPTNRRFNGIHWQRQSDRAVQLMVAVDGGFSEPLTFMRVSDGTWRPWRQLFHQGSILGTVSQSGGVPTGAIIEQGSNANGWYVRYADGTQICICAPAGGVDVDSPSGGVHVSSDKTIDLPASFANSGADALAFANASGSRLRWCTAQVGALTIIARMYNVNSVSGQVILAGAIGRWF